MAGVSIEGTKITKLNAKYIHQEPRRRRALFGVPALIPGCLMAFP